MSQTSRALSGLLLLMRWLHAGDDLSRPADVDQSADRPVIRSEGLSKCPRHAPSLLSAHTSSGCRTGVPPALDLRADIKSP
jgi:hypothetical protein